MTRDTCLCTDTNTLGHYQYLYHQSHSLTSHHSMLIRAQISINVLYARRFYLSEQIQAPSQSLVAASSYFFVSYLVVSFFPNVFEIIFQVFQLGSM